MAETKEGVVKRHIKKILKDAGAYFYMPVSNGMGRHGVPDFLVCYRGKFIGIEAKAGRGTTTALQDREIAEIVMSGGVAIVVNEHNLDELKELLNEGT
jgi:Holliday junction resolvase